MCCFFSNGNHLFLSCSFGMTELTPTASSSPVSSMTLVEYWLPRLWFLTLSMVGGMFVFQIVFALMPAPSGHWPHMTAVMLTAVPIISMAGLCVFEIGQSLKTKCELLQVIVGSVAVVHVFVFRTGIVMLPLLSFSLVDSSFRVVKRVCVKHK